MPRIEVWIFEEERWDIFELHKTIYSSYDFKISEKFVDRFNKVIEILEAMQNYLYIKKVKKVEKE